MHGGAVSRTWRDANDNLVYPDRVGVDDFVSQALDKLEGFTPSQAAALGIALLDQAGLSPHLQDKIADLLRKENQELLP